MRPYPRLLAIAAEPCFDAPDFAIRVAAIAAAGPAVGIVVRSTGSVEQIRRRVERVRALTRPAEAATIAPVASLGGTGPVQGIEVGAAELGRIPAIREGAPGAWVLGVVGSASEMAAAVRHGVDLVAVDGGGPGAESTDLSPPPGRDWPIPVYRAVSLDGDWIARARASGAWGVAVGAELWSAPDSARATEAILAGWLG